MKKNKGNTHVFATLISVLRPSAFILSLSFLAVPLTASAAFENGANAIDLLGQYDQTSFTDPVPVYTKSGANDGANRFGLSLPGYMAYDTTGQRLFLTDTSNNRVLVYALNSDGTFVDHLPDNVLGQPNFYANTAATQQNGLNAPLGIEYDSANNRLFIAQGTGQRITVYDVSAITDGENATNVLGQPDFTTGTASVQQNGVNFPQGLAYDSTGNRLFVAQSTGNRITVYDVSSITDGENATNVLGQPNFTDSTAATQQNGMNSPTGLAYDGTNNRLFSVHSSSNRLVVYDVSAITDGENATNVLGQSNYTSSSQLILQNTIGNASGVVYDSANNRLFVAVGAGNRVLVFDVAAITTGENATNILGQPTFVSSVGGGQQNSMISPRGIAYDHANNRLFVSEPAGNRVMAFDISAITNSQNAVDLIGQYDQTSFTDPVPVYTKSGANDGANKFGFSSPTGVVLDSTNHRLFLADSSNNRVLVYAVNANGTFVDRIPDNILGQSNYYSNTAATQQNGMSIPRSMAYDSSNSRLFVAEQSNSRVTVFDVASITDGENATNVLGQPSFVTSTAATQQNGMSIPQGVAYDSTSNRLFVGEQNNNRITVFDVATITDGENAVDLLGQYDQTSFTDPVPVYTKGTANDGANRFGFSSPSNIAFSAEALRLFVSDLSNNRILVYAMNADGTFVDRVPDNVLGQSNYYTSAAATQQNGLNAPFGITYDSANNRLFVANSSANRVTVYDTAAITDGENATNVLGQPGYTTSTAATQQNGLNAPLGLAYDSTNNRLFVSQSVASRVTVYDVASITDGENATNVLGQPGYTTSTAATQQNSLNRPFGLAYDSANNRLFVADNFNSRIMFYDVTSITDGENATNILGKSVFNVSTAATQQNGLSSPNGLGYDSANTKLFVADTNNNRVLVYDIADIINGENATNIIGQATFTAFTSSTAQQNGMGIPQGIAYDSTNNRLFVSQSTANRMTVYDVASITDGENAVDLLGQYDETSFTSPVPVYTKSAANNGPNKFGLSAPQSMAIDATNHRLFVVDGNNSRVLAYALSTDGTFVDRVPDNVLGQSTYYSNTSTTQQNGMIVQNGIAYDSANDRLFVANTSRVVLFDTAAITDGENATNVLGQSNFTATTATSQQNSMSGVRGLAYDSTNSQLFAVEQTNNRVSVFDVSLGAASSSSSSSAPTETTTSTTTTPSGGSRGGSAAMAQRILEATEAFTRTSTDVPSSPNTSAGSTSLFTDVPLHSWFAPYVRDLVLHKIAEGYRDRSGKLTGDFGPANPVTKAEMLKMILNVTGNTPDLSRDLIPQNKSARNTWAALYVMKAEVLGLSVFPEYPDTIDVHAPATRGEVMQTLIEALNFEENALKNSSFSDVPTTHPYTKAIALAASMKLISGDTDADGNLLNTFRPDESINRAEVAKVMVGVIRKKMQ